MKLTEIARRERQRRIDAGDESVRLKFSVLTGPAAVGATGASAKALNGAPQAKSAGTNAPSWAGKPAEGAPPTWGSAGAKGASAGPAWAKAGKGWPPAPQGLRASGPYGKGKQ